MFDLQKNSHRENIDWIADEKIYAFGKGPSTGVDVEKFLTENNVEDMLRERAARAGQPLNYDVSIVDLLKLLGLDSSLGARKKLAKQFGYEGDFNDAFNMNVWLHQQVMQRFIEGGGAPKIDV